MQLTVQAGCKRVVCVAVGAGRQHDLKLLQQSQTRFARLVRVKADKGYQGIWRWHANSQTPQKKPPRGHLSPEQRCANRQLARERIVVEHVNRRFKVFRILGERYRNRRRRFGLRVNLIAGIYNRDLPT